MKERKKAEKRNEKVESGDDEKNEDDKEEGEKASDEEEEDEKEHNKKRKEEEVKEEKGPQVHVLSRANISNLWPSAAITRMANTKSKQPHKNSKK